MGGWRLGGLALAGLAGAALQLRQPALWPAAVYLALVAAGAALLALRRYPAVLLGLALLAFGVTGGRAGLRLSEALAPALEGRDLEVVGVVAGLPRRGAEGLRFVFEIEQAHEAGRAVDVPRRVSLGWYGAWGDKGGASLPSLRAGERWRFTVRLAAPHGSLNPHGFDFELWLFERGIRAVGHVRTTARAAPAHRLDPAAGFIVERVRQRLRDAVLHAVDTPRTAGVLAALAVGDQAAIDRADWELFRVTGVAHLMSISGLHVTMFAWLAGAVVGRLWRRSARAMLCCPAPTAARWGGVLAAAAYALLAGWGVPAQRTVWMLTTAAVLASLGLRWPWPLVLAAAAVVVTALDPWALLQPGFWLSFVAVGLLMASEPARDAQPSSPGPQRVAHWLRATLRAQALATLGLAPLTLLFFQQVSIVGFVANLVAIPVVTLLVTPLALLGVLVAPLWLVAAAVLEVLFALLERLAALPAATWSAAAATGWALAAGVLAAALIALPLPRRLRALGLPLLLPMLLAPAHGVPAPGHFAVVVPDVGQGGAVLVRTARHLLVYDAGPRYSADSDAGRRVLVPLLRARGERRVDVLLISHPDSDHAGGAQSLRQALPVSALRGSLEPAHPLAALAPFEPCRAGQRWQWDGVSFEVLHPGAAGRRTNANAASCVLQVRDAEGRALLLTGDIEAAQETALVNAHGARLKSEILLVPHHGSGTSSSARFVDAVSPAFAVVQAGHRNRFGHPTPEVVQRYLARGAVVIDSASCGAWQWAGGRWRCEREASRRYWHHRVVAAGRGRDGIASAP